jgi:hypothetical protein
VCVYSKALSFAPHAEEIAFGVPGEDMSSNCQTRRSCKTFRGSARDSDVHHSFTCADRVCCRRLCQEIAQLA